MSPSSSYAQDNSGEAFVGISAGVHSLGIREEAEARVLGAEADDDSVIAGVFVGYDIHLGDSLFIGAEANYHVGFDEQEREFGASARLGLRLSGGTKLFARVGYQQYEVDYNLIVRDDTIDFSDLDETRGDILLGIGADVALGRVFFRANIDTIGFESIRPTVGLGLRF